LVGGDCIFTKKLSSVLERGFAGSIAGQHPGYFENSIVALEQLRPSGGVLLINLFNDRDVASGLGSDLG
jgi:hypothetical protein